MLRVSMERDRDDDFELPVLKRRRNHASTEKARVCSREVVPKNTEKNNRWALNVLSRMLAK